MDGVLEAGKMKVSLESIVKIAEGAGKVIMSIYNSPSGDWELQTKADDSPLTRADISANKHIVDHLTALHPDVPILTEEAAAAPYSDRLKWTHYWCVDPLDGTKEFVKRNGEFTVNIALMECPSAGAPARPVLGVVHAPVLGESYFAARGHGAHSRGGRVRARVFDETDAGLTLVCSRSHRDERTERFLTKYDRPQTLAKGSSLKFMLVASGEAHVYPRLAPTMEWDTAASQIIVEEAGGVVVREEDGKPVEYNKENLLNPFFIVYGNRLNK